MKQNRTPNVLLKLIDEFNKSLFTDENKKALESMKEYRPSVDHVFFGENILFYAARKVAGSDDKSKARSFLKDFYTWFQEHFPNSQNRALLYALTRHDRDAFVELLRVYKDLESIAGSEYLLWDLFPTAQSLQALQDIPIDRYQVIKDQMIAHTQDYLSKRFPVLSTEQKKNVLLTYVDLRNSYGEKTTKQDVNINNYIGMMPWHVQSEIARKTSGSAGEIFLWIRQLCTILFLLACVYFFYSTLGDLMFWSQVMPFVASLFLKSMAPIAWLGTLMPSMFLSVLSYVGDVFCGLGYLMNFSLTGMLTLGGVFGFFMSIGYLLKEVFVNMFSETVDFESCRPIVPIKSAVLDTCPLPKQVDSSSRFVVDGTLVNSSKNADGPSQ